MVGKVSYRVRAALAIALTGCGTQAMAEQLVAAADKMDRIEVTGSRIATSDVESVSPIAIVSAETIKAEGYQSLDLILNNFPQFLGGDGARINNSGSGIATADLRGLFAQRTLTLLNGRRLPAGSPYTIAPDLNQVPVPLISRVEILTGGASAVYGSDAIAGVVNIILNDRFEGVQADFSYDFYNHRQKNDYVQGLLRASGFEVPGDKASDGAGTSASIAVGGTFAGDKGHAMVFFRHLKSDPVYHADRDYSACAISANDPVAPSFHFCGGSPTTYPGQFIDAANGRRWTLDSASGIVRPFVRLTDLYNFAPLNYFQRPIERYGANAFATFNTSSALRFYSEFGFTDSRSEYQLAPTGFFLTTLTSVRHDNPLLTDDWRARLVFRDSAGNRSTAPDSTATVVIGRRSVESGPRHGEQDYVSHRLVVGAKGEAARHWDYDGYLLSSRVALLETFQHDFSLTRIARSLDVVSDPATGAPACASALNGTDPRCVPWNIWSIGGVTPQAIAYLDQGSQIHASISQRIGGGNFSGDLGAYGLRLPWTSRGIEMVLGAERRTERMDVEPDSANFSGDLAGSGGALPSLRGSVSVNDLYGELRMPVLDTLSLSGSYRHSSYDTGKRTNTYGLGFNAAPWSFARFRGSYQRAVRAANIGELFTPQTASNWGLVNNDPCEGAAPARSLADCQRTGVAAASYGHIPETPVGVGFRSTDGGNPDLAPEAGTTWTLGVALAPVQRLSITLDYFDIRVTDFIYSRGADVTFQQCIDTGDPSVCRLVMRDPALGTLWLDGANVINTYQNIGNVHVAGVDIAVDYRYPFATNQALSISGLGAYMGTYTWQPYPGSQTNQCAGYYFFNCGDPRPKWRHRVTGTWSSPWSADLSLTWRYMGAVVNQNPAAIIRKLGAVNYLDISGSWSPTKSITLRAGVANATDKDPPVVAVGSNANTFATNYDVLGRHVYASLTAKF
jgi:outer membrane receptor protein involved in Fe transport